MTLCRARPSDDVGTGQDSPVVDDDAAAEWLSHQGIAWIAATQTSASGLDLFARAHDPSGRDYVRSWRAGSVAGAVA